MTILLPTTPGIRRATPEPLDFGLVMRAPSGAGTTRIEKPGLRWRCSFATPEMTGETLRVFSVRLARAVSEGLRVPFPLMGVNQSGGGNPVVNGAGAAGTSLPVRSATAGFVVKEGFWLNVVGAGGQHDLHQCSADTTLAAGSGTIPVWPPLRQALPDGALVVIDAPRFEGLVTEWGPIDRPHTKVSGVSFVLEER